LNRLPIGQKDAEHSNKPSPELNSERFRKEQLGGEAGHSISKLSFDGQKEMEAAKPKAAEKAAKEPT